MKSKFECPACSLTLEWHQQKLWCGSVNCLNGICAKGVAPDKETGPLTEDQAHHILLNLMGKKIE